MLIILNLIDIKILILQCLSFFLMVRSHCQAESSIFPTHNQIKYMIPASNSKTDLRISEEESASVYVAYVLSLHIWRLL